MYTFRNQGRYRVDKWGILYFINDYGDLMEKVDFYLRHDTERVAIADRGYAKVQAEYTYLQRVERILETLRVE